MVNTLSSNAVYFYGLLCSSDINSYLHFCVEDIYHTSSTVTLNFSNDNVLLCLYKIYSWEKCVQVKMLGRESFASLVVKLNNYNSATCTLVWNTLIFQMCSFHFCIRH